MIHSEVVETRWAASSRTESPGVRVIAEAGVNHNGCLETAMTLVDAARECGADAVKFQWFKAEQLVTADAAQASYQRKACPEDGSQYAMLKRLELGNEDFRRLAEYSHERGIEFLASPFDEDSVEWLAALDVGCFKVASGELTNLPLLSRIGAQGKPVLLSTGMSFLGEIEAALATLSAAGAGDVTVLHCVSEYPAPVDQINLVAMDTLAQAFGCPVGYSDHSDGIDIALAAVARGAVVIEKHLTLDTTMAGPDHTASLDPQAFLAMVTAIRRIERALGDGRKRPAPCEQPQRELVRRSVVAGRDIDAGEVLAQGDLLLKRPGSGLPAAALPQLIGRVARRRIGRDALLDWADLT
ncbi:MAG: N-acetylneuraminate synthase [Halomonas sp.]|nr:N-acetylneuraminate synthase [Halomonas sp.]